MKKILCLFSVIVALSFATQTWGQKYFTRDGQITFTSETPMEKIEAVNQKATSVLDAASGQVEFAVLIKGFQFEKALMQEHFNENYMESTKFPKATFKGQITDMDLVDLTKDGVYPITVKGDLMIHGVTNPVVADGKLEVKNGAIHARSSFNLSPEEYGIKIPAVVRDNIAQSLKVEVAVNYELLTNGS
ncbi:MAG: YceI family protein [Lewinellaceae bacterium]|nr:YceI family protein [Lewinellaceae bacterium]